MNGESMSIEEARRVVRAAGEAAEKVVGLMAAEQVAQGAAYAAEVMGDVKALKKRAMAYSAAKKSDVARKVARGMCREEKEWEDAFAEWDAAMEKMRAADEKRSEALRKWKTMEETMGVEWWTGGMLAHARRIVAAADDRAVLREVVGLDLDTADGAPARRRIL